MSKSGTIGLPHTGAWLFAECLCLRPPANNHQASFTPGYTESKARANPARSSLEPVGPSP